MTNTLKKKKLSRRKDIVLKKIVVYFDICSSTSILEELLRTENQNRWRGLITSLEGYLMNVPFPVEFKLYKFLGDGWILLFEPCWKGLPFFELLEGLADEFSRLYKKRISKVLSIQIPVVGITFGMDIGSCVEITMDKHKEYIGRPLNIAGRLQNAVGQRDDDPANKGLVSRNLMAKFIDEKQIKKKYRILNVKRELKNISGGEDYRCLKVELK